MSGIQELINRINRLETMLKISTETLEEIANTPRNKGAKRKAFSTLMFLETQAKGLTND